MKQAATGQYCKNLKQYKNIAQVAPNRIKLNSQKYTEATIKVTNWTFKEKILSWTFLQHFKHNNFSNLLACSFLLLSHTYPANSFYFSGPFYTCIWITDRGYLYLFTVYVTTKIFTKAAMNTPIDWSISVEMFKHFKQWIELYFFVNNIKAYQQLSKIQLQVRDKNLERYATPGYSQSKKKVYLTLSLVNFLSD